MPKLWEPYRPRGQCKSVDFLWEWYDLIKWYESSECTKENNQIYCMAEKDLKERRNV